MRDAGTSTDLLYLYDANGNVGQLIKTSDGSFGAKYQYYPYGGEIQAVGTYATVNPFRFSTKYWDTEHQALYYGYRYHKPKLGRWLSRDPIEERGDLNLLRFAANNPVSIYDLLGLDASTQPSDKCEYCGPDMTDFFMNLINSAVVWRRTQGEVSLKDGIHYLRMHGGEMFWFTTDGQYKTKGCPSGEQCAHTYWICGECVHDHWLGNFMFGYTARLLGVPDWIADCGAQNAQGPGPGDPLVNHLGDPIEYVDPLWDVAGYELGRSTFDLMSAIPVLKGSFCTFLRSDPHWGPANNTAVSLVPGTDPRYPTPKASGYGNCKKCPERLPVEVRDVYPGGGFSGNPAAWPQVTRLGFFQLP